MSNVDLDELDLNFDGLDDDEEATTETTTKRQSDEKSSKSSSSKSIGENKSENTIVLGTNSKDSNNNIDHENNDDDDELIFKVPLVPLVSSNKDKNSDSTQKFNDDLNEFKLNDDEDEDEFIRSQPMFSSTQSGLDQNVFKIPSIPPENKHKDDTTDCEFISTQTTKEIFERSSQQRKLDTSRETTLSNTSVIELIDNKEVWNYGFERLNEIFKNTRLKNALKKFTIDFYLKKLLQFNLLRIVDEGVPQLPLICLFITEISRANVNSHASVILADDRSLIKGTINKSIAKEHWSKLTVGTVLLLQDVSLIRMGKSSNPYQVWIDKENLLYIYYKNSQDDGSIDVYKYNEIKISEIESYVDEFESKFVKVSERILNMTSVNKSNTSALNSTSNKSSSSNKSASSGSAKVNQNSNQNNRPAPYKVPDKFSSKPPTSTSTTTTTTTKQNPPPAPQQPQKRVFSFKNPNSSKSSSENNNSNLDSTIICLSSSTQEKTDQNTISSTNRQVLSEEQLSQLIFGLEDEF